MSMDEDEWPWGYVDDSEPTDVAEKKRLTDDLLRRLRGSPPEPEPNVWAMLALRKAGKGKEAPLIPENTALNCFIILSNDSRWKGRVRWNDFAGRLEVHVPDEEPDPDRAIDVSATMVVHWMEEVYHLRTTEERVGRALNVVADLDRYSPVKDYLSSLVWDGTPRLDRLMAHYFRADDTALTSALGRCWMISAVARAMQPGCKVDTTLILCGSQGSGKSTAARILASPAWFSDSLLDIHSKDLFEVIHGTWIYELAELDAFNRGEWPKIKAILSSPADRYRRPYGKGSELRRRSVVFIGTTNRDDFLGDSTGSRRFWPVRVGQSRLDELQSDRDQLWAEATAAYARGEAWHLDAAHADALAEHNAGFETPHPWQDLIIDWLRQHPGRTEFRMIDLLTEAIGDRSRSSVMDGMTCGGILRRLGYEPRQATIGGVRAQWWCKP